MRTIFPAPGDADGSPGGAPGGSVGGELDLTALAAAYAYPEGRWVRVNFVQSADGAASLDGLSGGLSSAGDKRVFGILRVLADVIVAGAGTVRAENYKPARARPALAELRAGRPAAAPIAVVSQSLDLDLDAPLYTEAAPDSRTIVITSASADPGRRAAAAKVADVIVAGKDTVDLGGALAMLASRGLRRVLCEGGPRLFGELDAAGVVDELCLSLSPTLAGPGAARIISGPASPARPMTLHQVIADEGFLFCRYFTSKQNP